jgi:hypothetical protein
MTTTDAYNDSWRRLRTATATADNNCR